MGIEACARRKENNPDSGRPVRISRREFLQLVGAGTAAVLVGGCRPETLSQPLGPAASATPLPPTLTPQVPALAQVAIGQASSYQQALVRQQVEAMLDGLGGLADVVRPGDRVTLKVNLTGGTHFSPPPGLSATESYVTHPEVTRALGECLVDAGAGELYIVEAVYDAQSYPRWGYEDIAQGLDATLIDLNRPDPYPDFASAPVGDGWLIYETFSFHRILQETDVFISLAKMKCHWNTGVTLSMKNLIGLVPVSHYRLAPGDWWRSAFHGTGDEAWTRLPGVIMDLNRARPIDLALIDGIQTAEGGEVPRGTFDPVEPGVLIAGKSALATDAVAAAVMGFDPTIAPPTPPFIRTENYLNLARDLDLGTNRLEEIATVGTPIEEVLYPFEPSWEQ
jgi:uncharacterized protein (DUF362 family)